MHRFRAYYDNGIIIEYGNKRFIIDPLRKPSKSFNAILITHGHRDHVNPSAIRNAMPLIMSEETARVIRVRDGEGLRYIEASPRHEIVIDDVIVEIYNAGHVVGSLSYVLDFGAFRVGITGDFNVESSILLGGAEGLDVDVLIMEATYGSPDYVFPSRIAIYDELRGIVEDGIRNGIVLLMGQPLGRGQELAVLLKDYPMYIEPSIKVMNNVLGLKYGKVLSEIPQPGSVIIMGMPRDFVNTIRVLRSRYGIVKAVALSGMYAKRSRVARLRAIGVDALPLSSHSDFPGLVDFALNSGARIVYTVYGNAVRFAKYLRKFNIMSRVLPTPGQLTLDPFL
ncbi:MAG: mRNA 3'-end processing factor [Vulcanisaeta sp. MG_3]|nr:MAG: mRNA 3'-end processing factor [Vulcanisaeta sp. MG_3]